MLQAETHEESDQNADACSPRPAILAGLDRLDNI